METKKSQVESREPVPTYAFSVRELQMGIASAYAGGRGERGWSADSLRSITQNVPGAQTVLGPRSVLAWLEKTLKDLPSLKESPLDQHVYETFREMILDFRPTSSDGDAELQPEAFAPLASAVKAWLDTHLTLEDVTFLDEATAEHFSTGGLHKVNELVYYLPPKDGVMELHIGSVRHVPPMGRLRLFREGMQELKQHVRQEIAWGHPVKVIRGTSWIVSASPESVQRLGFRIVIVRDVNGRSTDTCELTVDEAWLKTDKKS